MVHAVWATKSRQPLLTKEVKPLVVKHIMENAFEKKLFVDSLDGFTEHMHCLFSLDAELSVSKTLQLIKGESSFWINKEKLTKSKFEWGDEYFAVSVSESAVPRVREYIQRQEIHHRSKSFADEYDEFRAKYGFKSLG